MKYRYRAAALVMAAALLGGCSAAIPAGLIPGAGTTSPGPETTVAPIPDKTPIPAAVPSLDRAEQVLATMTVREKVGQLFIIRPDSLDLTLPQEQINDAHTDGVTALSADRKATLVEYPVGGVAVFTKNIVDPAQLTSFLQDLQQNSAISLFTGIDEEGGKISRIANHAAFDVPQYESMEAIAATGDPSQARSVGKTIGDYLLAYGLNLDFAPDADVNTNPDNPVIGERAFGSDPKIAASMVAAEVEGLHEAGVMSAIKHFPGHGDTQTDSHYGYASSEKTWQEMQQCEMLPFLSGIGAGTDMVMVAHITTPNVTDDGLPASLSAQMITEKLREELGYNGVVITDSLAMEAITDAYSAAEAAKMSFAAGADILLMPNGMTEAFDAIVDAVESGEITEERLNESVRRILKLKENYGLL